MKNELTKEQCAGIITALNEAIEQGPWDKSNFLTAIGKNLQTIRDDFIAYTAAVQTPVAKPVAEPPKPTLRHTNQREVFVSLYSSNGIVLRSWEQILVNLPHQMISRPIYADEGKLQALIKTKENKLNEAYVAIYVDEGDILPLSAEKTPVDKLGTGLLSLKDKSLKLENIIRFIHLSDVYLFLRGRLVKMTPD